MNISQKRIIAMITDYMNLHDEAIYVSNYALFDDAKPNVWKTVNQTIKIRFLKKFDQSIMKNDTYIFEIVKIHTLNLPL
ncbi:MAG: hypothetical protein H7199_12060 [Burkholderiales bacterium]|nr:hypothetical protein [Flavobacterium sp.]